MNERDELAQYIADNDEITHAELADAILAAGYRKLEPVWAEGLINDGEYEYTISSDCDGSNVKHWKRRPEMVSTLEASSWEPTL